MNIKYYVILSSILFYILILQACSTSMLMIGGTAALVTTTWNDPRTIGMQLDDNILEAQITHTLYKNKQIKKFARIKNTVYQGDVLLTGQTPFINLSNKAIHLIRNTHGVKNIHNAIRNNRPICFRSIINDIWISNQIRMKFIIQNNLQLSNIKIVTENKEVFLLGHVTYLESQHAEETAYSINGVNKVYKLFTYI